MNTNRGGKVPGGSKWAWLQAVPMIWRPCAKKQNGTFLDNKNKPHSAIANLGASVFLVGVASDRRQ
jgi:hypothetical protein